MLSLDTQLLSKIANYLRENSHLPIKGGMWQNCEVLNVATQAIIACEWHLKEGGDPFFWSKNNPAFKKYLTENGGLHKLMVEGHIVMENYNGDLTPPENTLYKDEKPQIFRVTNKLLKHAEEFID